MNNQNRARSVRAFVSALAATLLLSLALPAFAADPVSGVVNVNVASISELQLLPGVGESRAQAIVALREERGGFKKVDELTDVKGIGESVLAKMRPYVRLDGKTTATP